MIPTPLDDADNKKRTPLLVILFLGMPLPLLLLLLLQQLLQLLPLLEQQQTSTTTTITTTITITITSTSAASTTSISTPSLLGMCFFMPLNLVTHLPPTSSYFLPCNYSICCFLLTAKYFLIATYCFLHHTFSILLPLYHCHTGV